MCERSGRLTVARCVDHIVPHKGDQLLFFDAGNWQSLCLNCHNSRKQCIERRGYDSTPNADGYPPTRAIHSTNHKDGGEGKTK